MFESLPQHLREYGLNADVRTLLLLRRGFEKGLVNTLGDIYLLLRGIVVKEPEEMGPYATAFYAYFLDINIRRGEKLDNAVARSQAFRDWRKDFEEAWEGEQPDMRELISRFLDEVHLTTHDIQNMMDGNEILNNDDPNAPDKHPQTEFDKNKQVKNAADYSNISLEELRRRMEQVVKQQRSRHEGGSHWIGAYGNSPYGHGGAAMGGIRVGGTGGGKMARAVIGDPQFYPVDRDAILRDDNMDAALASLKGIEEETAEKRLDISKTIRKGLEEGGIFLPYEKENIHQKMQVVLLIDNGGFSMYPYVKSVQKLFSKMKTRFAHDLKVYYFHNTIYGGAYSDERRRDFVPLSRLLDLDKDYSVFILGDAAMAPYELDRQSQENWQELRKKFKRIAWLNPTRADHWKYTLTTQWLYQTFPMYPLTPKGIEEAVLKMNKERKGR